MSSSWSAQIVRQASHRFERWSPQKVLRWTFSAFGDRAVMGTGFGYSGVALAHLLSTVRPGATLFYLDTDLLFEETYALRDALDARLDLNIERVRAGVSLAEQEEKHGDALWDHSPDECCFIRKVQPLRRYLSGKAAWVTAIRRDQSASRAATAPVEWSGAHGLVKVNPLARWTSADVWNYVRKHNLPYNPLHDEGFPSIGCVPCTDPVASGGDDRAGRWAGHSKTECGLHLESQSA